MRQTVKRFFLERFLDGKRYCNVFRVACYVFVYFWLASVWGVVLCSNMLFGDKTIS